ncbi:MAG: YggS family pyridoxal phosphate-dependent enzyme [Verrucomicrobiae bacterium]|nr:YggS family pyridoxal phosphate-dependent enzyme [Verrucomicrobiae bacterium]
MHENLSTRLGEIRQRIAESAAKSGREADAVTLLAVTKKVPLEVLREARYLGLLLFGENKVQEAKVKIPELPANLRWHMIGHLQSNKARDAVHLFDMIHSVDSPALARDLNKWADHFSKTTKILLEVNVSGESSKFGLPPETLPATAEMINALPRLECHGLMTLAPYAEDPEKSRPHFARLRELRDHLESTLGLRLPVLSMGMSGDYQVAIEEGSTLVRIGTALFGKRQ